MLVGLGLVSFILASTFLYLPYLVKTMGHILLTLPEQVGLIERVQADDVYPEDRTGLGPAIQREENFRILPSLRRARGHRCRD